jgi:hypothetical protein
MRLCSSSNGPNFTLRYERGDGEKRSLGTYDRGCTSSRRGVYEYLKGCMNIKNLYLFADSLPTGLPQVLDEKPVLHLSLRTTRKKIQSI